MKLERTDYPELVIGIAAPMGVDIDAICESLENQLRIVRYEPQTIKLTDVIANQPTNVPKPSQSDFATAITYKIEHANALCEKFGEPSTLARFAVQEIRRLRRLIEPDPDIIPSSRAYIIRQLKRPQEVQLLRGIYGRQFILVSAYGAAKARRAIIIERLKRTLPTQTSDSEISGKADALIERDAAEERHDSGQQLRETFHLGDVFIDGINKHEMDKNLNRFIQAFFGRTDITPDKNEYGMYAAKSASLRSSDLSRQVGAAIFTDDGEIITQGCNEVPKALGGTYWDGEEPDHRDVVLGRDPNDTMKREVLRDLLERLETNGLLSDTAKSLGTPVEILSALCRKPNLEERKSDTGVGALVGSAIMDLTEFGRIVHAEMCAICDAARIGRSIKGGTLYCTTFPCHNCTKHILAAGIKVVVYIEPYPKSKAQELHSNEIEVENTVAGKVAFLPFLGISPYRYRDIFQKGRRKDKSGQAKRWYSEDNVSQPMLDAVLPSYLEAELASLSIFIGELKAAESGN